MTTMRRRLLVAAVLLAAAGISVVLWLVALRTDNTGLEMWLLIGDGLLVGGLASAPTGVYLMRQGRGAGLGAASSLNQYETNDDADEIERLTR